MPRSAVRAVLLPVLLLVAAAATVARAAALVAAPGGGDPAYLHLYRFAAGEREALCNDGSPAGIYYRKASDPSSRQWVVHLQGGFWCWDAASCADRWKQTPVLVSSLTWPSDMQMGGVLSQNASVNPAYYSAHQVYVPYCTSDSWSGDVNVGPNTDLHRFPAGWNFLGRPTLRRVFQTLLGDPSFGMASAEHVLFSGCSAGGQGVLVNADFVRSLLPATIGMHALADAGWLVDRKPFSGSNLPLSQQVIVARSLWNWTFDDSCSEALGSAESWRCFFGMYVASYIEAPVLIQAEQYDQFQLWWDGVTVPIPSSQQQWAAEFREEFSATIAHAPHAFSAACYGHCLAEDDALFSGVFVDGTSLAQTLVSFVSVPQPNGPHHIDTCSSFNCSRGCPAAPSSSA